MDTSESSKIDDIPRVEVEAGTVSTTPVTFPTTESNIPQSSSSLLTHSDKLSELPSATPPVGRVRTPSRPRRTDASVPVQPSSPSLGHLAKAASEEGGQETPGKETPRGRVSFDESDRASLPSFQKLREAADLT
ncbi:hypothetical protein BD410DRAFT_542489 [Rickenella mellea]|uniref:Uncharacterized protein n=1 Tax=Rickenella mellea TaxID=50990 RepID=A0A4Y7PQD4_9AGAM|nr:hypothetical protein BD410DRAFT_542489 [Rickenella mellea]